MPWKITHLFAQKYHRWVLSRKPKIFCIGRNKTGTTSMEILFRNLGYQVGSQRAGEMLLKQWGNNEFKEIIRFARYGGEFFQDVPFSLPETYKHLDAAFPKSKFILTIRDSPEVWVDSQLRSAAKRFGNGKVPGKQELMNSKYNYPGYAWEANQLIYHTPGDDPYNAEMIMKHYVKYNADVIEYFKNRPDKLLVVNLKDADAGTRIAGFIGMKEPVKIPWENKT